MFKKCIATYLALLFVLTPFCTALAAGKRNNAVMDEQKLLNALIANAPFDVTAFKNVQADDQQLAAAVAQSAQQLLGLLDKHDKEFSLLINTICKRRVLNKSAADIKYMILSNLQEMADNPGVTPGCEPPWAISRIIFFAFVPLLFIDFIYVLVYYPGETNCTIKWGSWWLSALFLSLAISRTYNICTENSKEDPNETIIAGYESDRTAMQTLAFIFFGIGVFNANYCGD